jgi:putative ABC transport system ATP-binding protein
MALFDELHEQGITLIVVTHDMEVARRAERIITIRDGEILSDERTRPVPVVAIHHVTVPATNGKEPAPTLQA